MRVRQAGPGEAGALGVVVPTGRGGASRVRSPCASAERELVRQVVRREVPSGDGSAGRTRRQATAAQRPDYSRRTTTAAPNVANQPPSLPVSR
ncbi:hypothetical protein rosag_46610 [Roseisolibacter agri]|uniref:Uncharacterized protein n=1 Tax=Roseisolibacter agri TaxID=2014610 RepID=A0AA37QLQ2_9BACT|nr:hypothetical protein rosag_46610 [Roseisolibacter agri]